MNIEQEKMYIKTIQSLEKQIRFLREEKETVQGKMNELANEIEQLKKDNLNLYNTYLTTLTEYNTLKNSQF